jgi:hypothetical protein
LLSSLLPSAGAAVDLPSTSLSTIVGDILGG